MLAASLWRRPAAQPRPGVANLIVFLWAARPRRRAGHPCGRRRRPRGRGRRLLRRRRPDGARPAWLRLAQVADTLLCPKPRAGPRLTRRPAFAEEWAGVDLRGPACESDDTQSSASAPSSRPRSVRSECARRANYVRELLRETTKPSPDQASSVTFAGSAWSSVAVQLARRFSASSDLEPGSAVYVRMVSPVSALSSSISNVRLRSPTTGW